MLRALERFPVEEPRARELTPTLLAPQMSPEGRRACDQAQVAWLDLAGSAQIAYNLLRLTGWSGETRYEDAALGVYRALGETLRAYPMAFGMMLIGVDLYLRRPVEIALVGDSSQPEIGAMLRVVREPYRPRALVAHAAANAGADAIPALLRGRALREGSPAAYVCENFVCAAPVTSSTALAGQLNHASPERGLASNG